MTTYVPSAEKVFELDVTCGSPTMLGRINGGNGMMIPITGGTVKGEMLSGEVLPGGADWAIRYENGRSVVDARYAIKADDDTVIQIFNGASLHLELGEDKAIPTMVTSPRFIAPEGPHDWLNCGVYVGTLAPIMGSTFAVRVVIFRMV